MNKSKGISRPYVREHPGKTWSWHFTIDGVEACGSPLTFYSEDAAIANWHEVAAEISAWVNTAKKDLAE